MPVGHSARRVTVGVLSTHHLDHYWGYPSLQYGIANSPQIVNRLGRTNYAGVNGSRGEGAPGSVWSQWEGIFYNRSRTRLTAVTDGTSQTLLFGEGLGQMANGTRLTAWSWIGFGSTGTAPGFRSPRDCTINQFGSRHPGLVQFCFADGSVRGLRHEGTFYDTRPFSGPPLIFAPQWPLPEAGSLWYVLQQLAGRRDGVSPDTTRLEP